MVSSRSQLKNVSRARGAIDVSDGPGGAAGQTGSFVIHLPNMLEVNVDPLGLTVEDEGARVFPE
jgi:hypothetical protein